jgi:ABC-type glutathione transport system ATPase component
MSALFEIRELVLEHRRRDGRIVRALEHTSLQLLHGECLALLGESGSGKSSLARVLVRLAEPRSGAVLYRPTRAAAPLDFLALRGRALAEVRRALGIVFQDPYQSLNPRQSVGAAIAEPLVVHGVLARRAARVRAGELLARVGLEPEVGARFPSEFSGGERQRIAIARALALTPRCLILDEPVSALDASVRSQVLNLLADLRAEQELTYLFITHDLALARVFAERVVVLSQGGVVEEGPAGEVLERPRHAATQRLLAGLPAGPTAPGPARSPGVRAGP